ncbi:MAG: hopanoid biosynthesis-associated protein HpnK [Armatimonadota bacterium]|jgi:hopanoid biosynthesis associated protein HpnK
MAVQLIISADDFGATDQINSAIIRAHREGVLTSAGLMVTGEAAGDAVRLAKEQPGLAVGLHLALSDARSALPKSKIPRLVDNHQRFANNPVKAALQYFFDKEARSQLRLEIAAQFEMFAATGLELSHVDGHQHMHAHPAVLPVVIELAKEYGAKGIRVPRDPLWANFAADRTHIVSKLAVAAGHGYLAAVCRKKLRGCDLAVCDMAIGSLMSGSMNPDYVINILGRLKARKLEMFFHPSESAQPVPFGPNRGDLETLLEPALKAFISQGYQLTTYENLAKSEERVGLV